MAVDLMNHPPNEDTPEHEQKDKSKDAQPEQPEAQSGQSEQKGKSREAQPEQAEAQKPSESTTEAEQFREESPQVDWDESSSVSPCSPVVDPRNESSSPSRNENLSQQRKSFLLSFDQTLNSAHGEKLKKTPSSEVHVSDTVNEPHGADIEAKKHLVYVYKPTQRVTREDLLKLYSPFDDSCRKLFSPEWQ